MSNDDRAAEAHRWLHHADEEFDGSWIAADAETVDDRKAIIGHDYKREDHCFRALIKS